MITPARGDSVLPGWSKPAGLKANDSNSGTWSVRCGLSGWPSGGTNPDWPGGSTLSALRTPAAAPEGSTRTSATAAAIVFHDGFQATSFLLLDYVCGRYQPQCRPDGIAARKAAARVADDERPELRALRDPD